MDAEIADCTSSAASSISRSSSNSSVIRLCPSPLTEDMVETPGMRENCPSSTVATDDAMFSALAPGRVAVTSMIG